MLIDIPLDEVQRQLRRIQLLVEELDLRISEIERLCNKVVADNEAALEDMRRKWESRH